MDEKKKNEKKKKKKMKSIEHTKCEEEMFHRKSRSILGVFIKKNVLDRRAGGCGPGRMCDIVQVKLLSSHTLEKPSLTQRALFPLLYS